MCVSTFSTTSVWNISQSKQNWARYIGLHVQYRLFLSDLIKLEFWGHIFVIHILKYQILSKKSVLWERTVQCGQTDGRTDGHDKRNSHFLQICAKTPKQYPGFLDMRQLTWSDFSQIWIFSTGSYLKKVLIIKFHVNSSSRSQVFIREKTFGRTDRRDRANSFFSRACVRVQNRGNLLLKQFSWKKVPSFRSGFRRILPGSCHCIQ